MKRSTTRGLVAALVFASLLTSIVASIGMLLVPVIAEELEVTASAAQWTLTINLLVGAVTTPLIGRLSDGPSKRRLLILTMGVVLLGSLIAALSSNLALLLVGRGLQGFAFSITAIAVSMARERLDAKRAHSAIATLSISVATGLGAGYPITGLVAQFFDFRFAFWFAAAIVVVALVFVLVAVQPLAREPKYERFDVLGSAMYSLGMTGLVIGVSQGPVLGWSSPAILGSLLGSVGAFGAWVVSARKVAAPLLDLRLLRIPDVLTSHLASLCLGTIGYLVMSCLAVISLAPAHSGFGAELDVLWAGIIIAPVALGSMATGWAMQRWPSARLLYWLIPIGSAALVLGVLVLALFRQDLWALAVCTMLTGVGMGAIAGAGPVLISSQVPIPELGSTIGFSQVLRMSGGAVGSAVAGATFAATAQASGLPSLSGILVTLAIGGVLAVLLTVGLVLYGVSRERRAGDSIAATEG